MATDIISAYRNVCRDLQGLEAYMIVAQARLKLAINVVYKGRIPSSEMCYVPLDRALVDYNSAVDEFNETLEAFDAMKAAKAQLKKIIYTMSDAEQMVILLHVEQNMSLREISDKTNYSYSHLRNVSSMMRKAEIA